MPTLMDELKKRGGVDPVRQRSVQLQNDPAMQEMQHYLQSHAHDDRLKEEADLRKHEVEAQANDPLRKEVDVLRIAEAETDHSNEVPDRYGAIDARLKWREEMDRKLKRLMQDTRLDLGSQLPTEAQHDLRCGHTDKRYDWYERHGQKQARKEKEAPAFISFDPKAPVMPGSLRSRDQDAPAMRDSRASNRASSCPRTSGAPPAVPVMQGSSSSTNLRAQSPLVLAGSTASRAQQATNRNRLELPLWNR